MIRGKETDGDHAAPRREVMTYRRVARRGRTSLPRRTVMSGGLRDTLRRALHGPACPWSHRPRGATLVLAGAFHGLAHTGRLSPRLAQCGARTRRRPWYVECHADTAQGGKREH